MHVLVSQDLPIYEPGLFEVVKEARGRNLFFSTDTHKHVAEGDIIFVRCATDPTDLAVPATFRAGCIQPSSTRRRGQGLSSCRQDRALWRCLTDTAVLCSVNTPTKTRGVGAGKAADLTYWEGAARMIASVSTSSKIVVEKSTVPVKTAEAIEKVLHPASHARTAQTIAEPRSWMRVGCKAPPLPL